MRKGKYKDAILQFIKNNPECTIDDISTAVNTSTNYTSTLTVQLYEEGQITYTRDSKNRKHYTFGTSDINAMANKKPSHFVLTKIDDDVLVEELRRRGYKGEVSKSNTYNL